MQADDPFELFAQWYAKAQALTIDKPHAMSVSTVSEVGVVSSRIVLLSRFSEQEGFVFHTNYLSSKGLAIAAHAQVALLFWWDELGFQVRISGQAQKTSSDSSNQYFENRPRGSQLGAWASEQSTEIDSRAILEQRLAHFQERFATEKSVPRPEHWGGYAVIPDQFEFWTNRDDRLHDRVVFERDGTAWRQSLLAP